MQDTRIDMFGNYHKFVVAILGAVISGLLLWFEPTQVPEWVNYIILLATALGVYQVPNKA